MENNDQTCLIVPCAGSGERFGGLAKQLRVVAGKPLFIHSILAFLPFVQSIIIPCSQEIRETIEAYLNQFQIKATVVNGGPDRFQSVWHGLLTCPTSCEKVLIHDAVRPGIDADAITQCILELDKHDAVLTAMPCPDSLKRGQNEFVSEHLDRDGVYLAQTPQGLRLSRIMDLYAEAIRNGKSYTDDVSLCHAHDIPVKIVPGKRRYLKVTYPEDLTIIASLLSK